ncbi:ABC-type multidrug transport system, ATPase component [Mycolicibacterium chubuense NBB4]|uniref:ABC-type multidrug transport system, ATPase component n=1 Tax=Mycolicibacterium chubuense (strain NBB4) TaxID=710421 RepID=I4BK87_MYCCN|nr:ATP-binding cassette domain-containing protein [Mycolicibacterium chubuense]AFM17694.1 ABC-type multidrug transport system, ATPase component [Mycolicibacterium chubuense NBB4]
MTNDIAVACRGLTKDYGGGHGVCDLNLDVPRGEIFGLIGPNGAGKTTLIRLLMDFIRPDRGAATLLGMDTHRDSVELKRRIGYLPGELMQWPKVSAGYVIGLLAGLRGGVDEGYIESLAERLRLDLARHYEDLSHGNKQKVGLLQAFMARPELLILDEPTLGLDPLMQREFRLLIDEAAEAGATVLLSSHVLAEVELVCDRIALIHDGRLLEVGSLDELRAMRVHRIEAVFTGALDVAGLDRLPRVSEAAISDHRLTCSVQGSVTPLLERLAAANVVELDSREISLEEVFVRAVANESSAAAHR